MDELRDIVRRFERGLTTTDEVVEEVLEWRTKVNAILDAEWAERQLKQEWSRSQMYNPAPVAYEDWKVWKMGTTPSMTEGL